MLEMVAKREGRMGRGSLCWLNGFVIILIHVYA